MLLEENSELLSLVEMINLIIIVIVIGVWLGILLKLSEVLRLNSPQTAFFLIVASFAALVVLARSADNVQEPSTKTTPSPTSQAIESPTQESSLAEATRLAQPKKPLVRKIACVDILNRGLEQGGIAYIDCSLSEAHCLRVRQLSQAGREERLILEGRLSYCNTQGW
jgi:hypothetical protein